MFTEKDPRLFEQVYSRIEMLRNPSRVVAFAGRVATLTALMRANRGEFEAFMRAGTTNAVTRQRGRAFLEAEVDRLLKPTAPRSAALLLDIERFKQFNLRGHDFGDQQLRHASDALERRDINEARVEEGGSVAFDVVRGLARGVRNTSRRGVLRRHAAVERQPTDQVFHYGGDEFAVLVSGIEAEGEVVGAIANRVVTGMLGNEELHSRLRADDITAFGVRAAGVILDRRCHHSLADVIAEADPKREGIVPLAHRAIEWQPDDGQWLHVDRLATPGE